jgi:uncharacterized protein (UPF0216 family)
MNEDKAITVQELAEFRKNTRIINYSEKFMQLPNNPPPDIFFHATKDIDIIYIDNIIMSGAATFILTDRQLVIHFDNDYINIDLFNKYITVIDKNENELEMKVHEFDRDVLIDDENKLPSYPLFEIKIEQACTSPELYNSLIYAKFNPTDTDKLLLAYIGFKNIYEISLQTTDLVNKFRKNNISAILQYEQCYIVYKSVLYKIDTIEDEYLLATPMIDNGIITPNTKIKYVDLINDFQIISPDALIFYKNTCIKDFDISALFSIDDIRNISYKDSIFSKMFDIYNMIVKEYSIEKEITSSMEDLYKVFNEILIKIFDDHTLSDIIENQQPIIYVEDGMCHRIHKMIIDLMRTNLKVIFG